jgi:hypothetical protein
MYFGNETRGEHFGFAELLHAEVRIVFGLREKALKAVDDAAFHAAGDRDDLAGDMA